MKFIIDNNNDPINLEHVISFYKSSTVTDLMKPPKYTIMFLTTKKNCLWYYKNKEERDMIYERLLAECKNILKI